MLKSYSDQLRITPRLGAITRGLKFGAKRLGPRVIVPGSLRPATAVCYAFLYAETFEKNTTSQIQLI